MFSRAAIFALTIVLAPPAAQAADLVVWWEEGFYPEEDDAIREIIAAFEQGSGTKVELVLLDQEELPEVVVDALVAGAPPDFAFGHLLQDYIGQWASEGRLVDLSEAVGSLVSLFEADVLAWAIWPDGSGQKALYALPIGVTRNHVHVWTSLLDSAGLSLIDIPSEWEAFWSFWCGEVQPAARAALGRDDIWGVGLPMSLQGDDTWSAFHQFINAYGAKYVTSGGRLVIDDPQVRQRLIRALDSYTAIWRGGCTPPESSSWGNIDNNVAFLDQRVVMTLNPTLSIPNALRGERPDDYYANTATIEWPLGPQGEPFPIVTDVLSGVVFKEGGNSGSAEAFVRFLMAEGWLAHYLDFSAERLLPPIAKLLDQPFWLDARDPHRMAAVMQLMSRPVAQEDAVAAGDWRYIRIDQEKVWAKAIHRVVTEGIIPEQAVDEAIVRIKQILAE